MEHFERNNILSTVTLEYPQQKQRVSALNMKLALFFKHSSNEVQLGNTVNVPWKYDEFAISSFKAASPSFATALGILLALWLLLLLRK